MGRYASMAGVTPEEMIKSMKITSENIKNISGLLPRYSAIYRIHDGEAKTLFVSDKLPGLLGMGKDEYHEITGNNALDIVLPQDRERLGKAISGFLASRNDLDYYYRVKSNFKGFDWVHLEAHICGEMDGDPVVIARYANMSHESSMLDMIISNSDRGAVVIDCSTYEVLYANERIIKDRGIDESDINNLMCYSMLKGKDSPCKDCTKMSDACEKTHDYYEYDEKTGRWKYVAWKKITWCMREAIVVYFKDTTREKEHEISLDRMNQMYQMAIEDAEELMWIYDPKERTITYQVDNPYTKKFCDALGMPAVVEDVPDSLIGMVAKEYREGFIKMFDTQSMKEQGLKYEYCSFIDGDTQWWRVLGRPVYDLDRNIKFVFCTGKNITEEKEAENNYRILVDQLAGMSRVGLASFRLNITKDKFIDGYSIYPDQYVYLKRDTVSEHFAAAIAGIADEEIKKRLAEEITCSNLIEKYKQGTHEIVLEYPIRSTQYDTKGRIKWMKTIHYLVMNPDTKDIEDISVVTEITKQKKNEKMLEHMATKGCDYLGLIDCASREVEFYSGSMKYDIIENNMRVSYDNAVSMLVDLHIEDDKKEAFNEEVKFDRIISSLSNESEITVYYDFIDGDKPLLKKQIKFSWFDEEKRDIFVVQDDITEAYVREQQRVAELKEALERANLASKAKTDFLSRMSHDIRTPLNGIIGMTYLTREMELPKQAADNLEKISTSSNFLLGIINDILDMTKMESQEIEINLEPYPFEDFISYVNAVIRPLCEEKQQNLVLDTNPIAGYVPMTDIKKLNRIYFNLLSNAVKYTPEGGTISLKIREQHVDENKIRFTITVSDNGVGISEDFQEHLFEPFSQENRSDVSKNRGTGLGLAIVKQLVDAFDGTIEVKSSKDNGASFIVNITSPVVRETSVVSKKEQDKKDHNKEYKAISGSHILLCEDHPLNQEITKILLEQKGAIIQIAEDGQKGIEAFSQSAPNYYDCILMDIRMPVLDGIEATKAIRMLERNDAKSVPIIAMTADAFAEDVQRCLDAGMDGHIAKPINPAILYDQVSEAIEGLRMQEGAPRS